MNYQVDRENCDEVRLRWSCLLYRSDAADERSSVDLGGRRIMKKKKTEKDRGESTSGQQREREGGGGEIGSGKGNKEKRGEW